MRTTGLLLALAGAAGAGDTLAGEWFATFGHGQGPMKLQQEGTRVSGRYGFGYAFSIEGELARDRVKVTLTEGSQSGDGEVVVWEGGDLFTGRFTLGGKEHFLGAYRVAPAVPEPVPGEVVRGQTESRLNFDLRVPRGYDGKKEYPAVVLLHGSNMTARAYVDTFAGRWRDLAERYVVVGFDGERLGAGSEPGRRMHNFTYVNYSGPDWGNEAVRHQSPALVAAGLRELKEKLPIRHFLVGGHSQGGFLTYPVFLYHPDLVAGAFPMSCSLLVQCEPDHFADAALREAQRRVPVAPVHGVNDTVVDFASGQYCWERLQDGGFPMLRFFTNRGAHAFAMLPVKEAVEWIERMAEPDPGRLLDHADVWLREKAYRDACAACLRARELDADGKLAKRVDAILAKVDAKAERAAKSLRKAIAANRDNRWVDDFWEFREQFGLAPAAADCLAEYAALRGRQQEPADRIVREARPIRDEKVRRELYQRILDSYYASSWWPAAKRWARK